MSDVETNLWLPKGKWGGAWDKLGDCDCHIHTTIYIDKIDN